MILAFAKNPDNQINIINTETNKVNTYTMKDIINNKIKIDNLKILGKRLIGDGFNLDRLGSSIDTKQKYLLYAELFDTKQRKLGYICIDNFGKKHIKSEYELIRLYRTNQTLNIAVDKEGEFIIKSHNIQKEIKQDTISYDIDKYVALYKLYNSLGLISTESRIEGKYEPVFGVYSTLAEVHIQSSFDCFMETHRLMYYILGHTKISRVVKIPLNFKIDNKVINMDKQFLYSITYEISGYKHSILVHPKDIKLINLLKLRKARVSVTHTQDIIDLLQYNYKIDEKTESLDSSADKYKKENIEYNIEQGILYRIDKGNIINTLTNEYFPLRINTKFNSGDIGLIYNHIS